MHDLTHASFFSGVGGLDLGLERAGWRTVSFSEIDPYASAVLAERYPGIPNLGDIVRVAGREQPGSSADGRSGQSDAGARRGDPSRPPSAEGVRVAAGVSGGPPDGRLATADGESDVGPAWQRAYLWTGGFPCQDLSVAGKRRGMVEGSRSNLAHAFLDLVERHRPPAILLENVPGLLSSHRGRDMATLLGRMAELGYGVAYRVLDARHFGVPQRRRRVFILGLRSGPDDPSGRVAAERAAEVLAVGSRCPRHPATGGEAGPGAPAGAPVGTLNARMGTGVHNGQDDHAGFLVANAVRAGGHGDPGIGRDGDEWRLVIPEGVDVQRDVDGDGVGEGSLPDAPGDGSERDIEPSVRHPRGRGGSEAHARRMRTPHGLAAGLDDRGELAATLNSGGNDGGFRTEPGEHLVATLRVGGRGDGAGSSYDNTPWTLAEGGMTADDPLLPLGLDSHRYRCAGNGVVANVSEWIGRRL